MSERPTKAVHGRRRAIYMTPETAAALIARIQLGMVDFEGAYRELNLAPGTGPQEATNRNEAYEEDNPKPTGDQT